MPSLQEEYEQRALADQFRDAPHLNVLLGEMLEKKITWHLEELARLRLLRERTPADVLGMSWNDLAALMNLR